LQLNAVAACFGVWIALLGHWGDLGGFTREFKSSQVNTLPKAKSQESADLNCPIFSECDCFKALTALPLGKIYNKCLYLGHAV
jgi:hypothetical protein